MKHQGQKLKLLYLKRFFEEYTDDVHGITVQRLIELLSQYGIKAERKSIYEDIQALKDFGCDIQPETGRAKEHFLWSRDFTLPEVKLLIDSIQSSKFLSEAKTRELIKKLQSLRSNHEAHQIKRHVIVANRVKSMNNSVHYHVDKIHKAISANSQIRCKYFDYDLKKQRTYFKKGDFYSLSPFALVYADDNYYLLAFDHSGKKGKMKHFRVDKMDAVEVSKEERVGVEEFNKIDMSAYTKYTFSMFGGEVEKVSMIFSNRLVGAVMDRFGRDVVVMPTDKDHFKITVPVAVSKQFYGWIVGLGKRVRIVEPESVREGMKKHLAEVSSLYS